MDNFTLLAILIIILGINAVFTFIISGSTGKNVSRDWRLSSIFVFTGFQLIIFQQHIPNLFSIISANYLIILGFYFQISAAITFLFRNQIKKQIHIPIISILYIFGFLYFTYIDFNTPARIIVISMLLSLIYIHAAIRMKQLAKRINSLREAKGLLFLFIAAALFYTARTIVTAMEMSRIETLFESNLSISISFIFPIVFNIVFYMGMFTTSIRQKNRLITMERDRFSYLFDFLNNTAKHLKLEELYPSIEEVLRKTLRTSVAAIFLLDDADILTITYSFNELNLPIKDVMKIKIGKGAAGRAVAEDRVISMKVKDYPIESIATTYSAMGVTDMVSAPIKAPAGIIGAISIAYTESITEKETFNKDFFYYLGEQIGLVLNNSLLYEKVTQMANVDPLTKLFNRRKMQELFRMELARAERGGSSFVIALADLDHFKRVNDEYSHECGDEVLISAANIFKNACRESDFICRWGGEEFLLIFIDSGISSAEIVAERIRDLFENNKCSCIDNSSTTISIGLTEYKKGLSMEELIANADEALYLAKSMGRNRIEIK